MPRPQVESFRLVADWIGSIGTVLAGPNVDWTIREAEMDRRCELAAGERRRGSAQDILWVSVEAGSIRLMGVEPAYLSTRPPALLASGMWIEVGEQPSAVVVSRESPSGGNDLWSAIDQFHLSAMACIQRSLAADASREAQRLLRRVEISRSQSKEVLEQLSAVIVRRSESARASTDAHDPLLAVCRMVGDAINAPIVRPAERIPVRQEFDDIVEIARASRLRVRRTLLRAKWWNRDVGPLVAWHGDERHPVALMPASRRRYLMIEPKSGATRVINEAFAAELSTEAAMLYQTLPARPLSLRDLLVFSMRAAPADLVRITAGAALLGLLSLAAPLIIHELVDSVIPRTELDQLVFCAAALAVTALAMAGAQIMQGIAMLRLEGVLDWKLQAAVIDRLLRLPASFFRQYTVGDLVARALGIDAIRRVFTGQTLRSLLAGMFCWFSFLPMFYFDFRLALIAAALTMVRAILIIRRECSPPLSRNPTFQLARQTGRIRTAAAHRGRKIASSCRNSSSTCRVDEAICRPEAAFHRFPARRQRAQRCRDVISHRRHAHHFCCSRSIRQPAHTRPRRLSRVLHGVRPGHSVCWRVGNGNERFVDRNSAPLPHPAVDRRYPRICRGSTFGWRAFRVV